MKTCTFAALVIIFSLADAFNNNRGSEASNTNANPIRRVVTLLQKMAKRIEAEGKEEEELYKKFNCYCRTSGGELTQAIVENEGKAPQVQSDIESSEAEVQQLQGDLKAHGEDRQAANAAMDAAKIQRSKEHEAYLSESEELRGYVTSLATAIPAIEKGMGGKGGFLQTETALQAKQLLRAVTSSTATTEYDRQVVASFLENRRSAESYVPQSGEIVGILKTMHDDFAKSLKETEDEEAGSVKVHQDLIGAKTKQVTSLGHSIEKKTERVGNLQVNIVNMKDDLSDTQAALVENKKFLSELEEGCKSKDGEWEERKQTRAEEMVAIHDTIKMLNSDDSLDLFKKTLALLQVQSDNVELVRNRALKMLRSIRETPQVGFLTLALSGGGAQGADFSKVIKMIDDLVALLKQEQFDDDSKKEYCNTQIDSVEDKLKDLHKSVEDSGATISQTTETIAQMETDLKVLEEGIAELDKNVQEASEQRQKEHHSHLELVKSNSAAKELLGIAKNRLNKFYNPKLHKPDEAKKVTEEERIYNNMGGESMLVEISHHVQRMRKESPTPPPATWGAYKKKSEESNGVMSMIDLLVRDLDKEITESTTDEKNAQENYERIMNEAAVKRTADTKSITTKQGAKAEAEEEKAQAEQSQKDDTKSMMATEKFKAQLHQECDWLVQNFDLRKQAREEEADSLKQAKAVLSGADFS